MVGAPKYRGQKLGRHVLPDSKREAEILAFLDMHNWGDAARSPVPGDASARRYERLALGGRRAVLMDAPEDKDGVCCPVDATPDDRIALGYNAQAQLAGSSLSAFVCVATALTRRGFSAPRILALDKNAGLLLLEDLGDNLYAHVLEKTPKREAELYEKAVHVLAAIYRASFSDTLQARGLTWHVGDYDDTALLAEVNLFLEWYIPHFEKPISGAAKAEWIQLWTQSFKSLRAHVPGLALRDFHAENIFDLGGSVGLIDFQDALFAHPSYDLVSLIEDARRDVSPPLAAPLISQFCQEAGIVEDDKFHTAYNVMAAQRNAKILGIFVRLAVRDKKPKYLGLIPRVAANFSKDISHPALATINTWMQKYAPSVFGDFR